MQVNRHRLQSIEEIEARGKELWASGKVDEWLAGCDPKVAKVHCSPSTGSDTAHPLLAGASRRQWAAAAGTCRRDRFPRRCVRGFTAHWSRPGQYSALVPRAIPSSVVRALALKVDQLTVSGNGVPTDPGDSISVEELVSQREANNYNILSRLREDEHSTELFAACVEDAKKGRMSHPEPLDFSSLAEVNLSPRFGVEQGVHDTVVRAPW